MVQLLSLATALTAASSLVGSALAHAGGHGPENLAKRDNHWHANKRSLADCANTLKGRSLMEKAVARRSEAAEKLRIKRGLESRPYLKARDFTADSNKTHLSEFNATMETPEQFLFGSNYSCLLTPEVTQGPYYVTGEYVRQNITEDQEGVPMYLDMQFIDTATCEPIKDIYLDLWHANATGVYSGVNVNGNGVGTEDLTNINKTFLRGVWKTDDEGVVQFETIFPGHYVGRATHTHVIAHSGGQVNANGTFSGGNVTHVGQLFYDESLRSAVEQMGPYSTNTQAITSNADDMWAPQQGEDDYDPYPEYVYLGDSVSDGLLAWISIGIDTSAVYTPTAAATLTADGGVAESDDLQGNGTAPSGGAPSGGIPSGGIPSGALPSSSTSA